MPDAGGEPPGTERTSARAPVRLAQALLDDALCGLRAGAADGARLLAPGERPTAAGHSPAIATLPPGPPALGYPVHRDSHGRYSPLLAVAATADAGPERGPGLFAMPGGQPHLNEPLLLRLGVPAARIAAVRPRLPQTWPRVPAALPKLLADLGLAAAMADDRPDGETGWLDRMALLPALDGPRRALWRELTTLAADWPRDSESALSVLDDPDAPTAEGVPPLLWDLVGGGNEARTLAARALARRLSVVELSSGTEANGLLTTLAATVMAQGGSVLYLHPDPALSARFARRLEAAVSGDVRHAVPLASPRRMPGEAREIARGLFALAEADDEAPVDAKRNARANERQLLELDRFTPDTTREPARLAEAHARIAEAETALQRLTAALPPHWLQARARRLAAPLDLDTCRSLERDGGRRARLGPELLAKARKLDEALGGDGAAATEAGAAWALLRDFADWQVAAARRSAAIDALGRLPETRALAARSAKHEQARLALARPLYREALIRRLTAAPAPTGRALRELAELPERWPADALRPLVAALPLWYGSPADVPLRLPALAGLFRLVLVDGAERVDLPSLLPALLRGRSAVVAGARRSRRRLLRAVAPPAEPAWAADPSASALTATLRLLEGTGTGVLRPCRVSRQHPVLADFLNTAFYEGALTVQGDMRRLRERCSDGLVGLRWQDVCGDVVAGPAGPVNAAEVNAAVRLVRAWDEARHFGAGSRLSVAIVGVLPGQPALLQAQLQRADLPQSTLERLTLGTPETLPGTAYDVLLLLPGLSERMPARLNAALARSSTTYHDVVGAARCGLIVLGDRRAALAAGGHAGRLAAMADAGTEVGVPAWRPGLTALLDRAGVAWQAGPRPGELRLLGGFGGRYVIRVAGAGVSIDDSRADPPAGCVPLQLTVEEVQSRGERLAERLARLV